MLCHAPRPHSVRSAPRRTCGCERTKRHRIGQYNPTSAFCSCTRMSRISSAVYQPACTFCSQHRVQCFVSAAQSVSRRRCSPQCRCPHSLTRQRHATVPSASLPPLQCAGKRLDGPLSHLTPGERFNCSLLLSFLPLASVSSLRRCAVRAAVPTGRSLRGCGLFRIQPPAVHFAAKRRRSYFALPAVSSSTQPSSSSSASAAASRGRPPSSFLRCNTCARRHPRLSVCWRRCRRPPRLTRPVPPARGGG